MDWQDELIAELKRTSAQPVATAGQSDDALLDAWKALAAGCASSIETIGDAIGAHLEQWGEAGDGRIRWQYGTRTLAARYDGQAGRIFLSLDLGHELAMEELSLAPDGGGLVDGRGHPATADDLVARFVRCLFRGAAE